MALYPRSAVFTSSDQPWMALVKQNLGCFFSPKGREGSVRDFKLGKPGILTGNRGFNLRVPQWG